MSSRFTFHCGALPLAVLAALAPGVAGAGPLLSSGDGSSTDNPFLYEEVSASCSDVCVFVPPPEPQAPPVLVDWSIGLRGAYQLRDDTGRYEVLVLPRVSLTRSGLRTELQFDADAEISRSDDDEIRIDALRASIDGAYRLDQWTEATASANLSITQADADAANQPAGTAEAPLVVSGDVGVSLARDVGRLQFAGRADLGRTVYGPTTLGDGSTIENWEQNNTVYGTGLRVGYAVTPILTAFVDTSASYQQFDGLPGGFNLDGTGYALRGGISGVWGDYLDAEASIGQGWRLYDDETRDAVTATLFDARIGFRPSPTLSLGAFVSTGIEGPGPNAPGTARIEYTAGADVAYIVNPWLTLRGNAAARYARFEGSAETESAFGIGAGADYLLNEMMVLNADYGFERQTVTPAPAEDIHRVSLGVTISR